MTLAHSTVFTASGSQATQLTVLMDWFADPVDSGVTADSFVERIYHYNFKVLVCGIVGDPVRVKHPQAATVSTSTLLKERKFHWILFNTIFFLLSASLVTKVRKYQTLLIYFKKNGMIVV